MPRQSPNQGLSTGQIEAHGYTGGYGETSRLEVLHGRARQVALENSIHNVDVIEQVKHGTKIAGTLLRIAFDECSMKLFIGPGFAFEK